MAEILSADVNGIEQGTEIIRSFLEKKGVKGNLNTRIILTAEESMVDLIQHADQDSQLSISTKCFLEEITVEISAKGKEYRFGDRLITVPEELWAVPNSDAESAIRNRILASHSRNIKYKHKNGVNSIHLSMDLPSRSLVKTIGSLISALVVGIILSLTVPAQWTQALNVSLLMPIKTIFLNILKMIAAPVVFFSMTSSVSQMGSTSELGRVGSRIIGIYLLTTVIAVGIGIGVFFLVRPGSADMTGLVSAAPALPSQPFSTSLKDIIVGIVPDNVISPFLETNMLQLIFLSLLWGLAIRNSKGYSKNLSILIESCNELFLRITSFVMRSVHVLVFCSILSLIITMGVHSLLLLLSMFATFLLGLLFMLLVYCLLMMISRINPLSILKSYAPFALQVFSTSSSSAAMPINMDYCQNVLQLPPKLYRFSIPLGATLNMDGMCILLAVESLTLAKVFGVPVPGSALLSLAFSIIVISIGAPGVPGAGIIIMSMLMDLLGVPAEAVTLVMGIGPIVGMFVCTSNCLGDVVATAIVAKRENMLSSESPLGSGRSSA